MPPVALPLRIFKEHNLISVGTIWLQHSKRHIFSKTLVAPHVALVRMTWIRVLILAVTWCFEIDLQKWLFKCLKILDKFCNRGCNYLQRKVSFEKRLGNIRISFITKCWYVKNWNWTRHILWRRFWSTDNMFIALYCIGRGAERVYLFS